MASPPVHETKSELALKLLREQIRSARLKPGQRLRVDKLAHDLDMSPTPVREALRLLQADGLVEYRPHHGVLVRRMGREQAEEIYAIRALLEPVAAKLATEKLTEERLQTLEMLHRQLKSAAALGQGVAVSVRNQAWHTAIYEGSDWPTLADLIRRLWDSFPWRTMWTLPGRIALSVAEHDAIMDAIRARDIPAVEANVRAHVQSSADDLLSYLDRPESTT